MATTTLQPLNGRPIVELDLGTAQAPDPLLVPGQFTYLKGAYDEPASMWKTCVHQIQAANRSLFIDRLRPKLLNDRLVRFRIGVNQGDVTQWRAWETHYILEAPFQAGQINASAAGYTFRMTTVDRLYTLNLEQRLRAQQGIVSQLVEQLATDFGFAGSVVEPTRDKFSFIQSYETDWMFLAERLLPAAVNTKGMGNYQLYAQNDQLHFHTPGWQNAGLKQLPYSVPGVAATGLVFLDRGGPALQSGAGGVRTVAYAPLTGESPTSLTTPTVALKLAKVIPSLGHVRTHLRHVGQNQLSLALAEAQNRYESGRLSTFGMTFTMANQPFLRPGDMVQLMVPSESWSGLYYLVKVQSTFAAGRLRGTYALERGELNDVQANFSALSAVDPTTAVATAPNTADGVPYNVSESPTTSLTRGEGDTLSEQGGPVVEVDDDPGG
jgi:hypothetical protein